jgi:hypothetical protein
MVKINIHNWVATRSTRLATLRNICFVVFSLLISVKMAAQTASKSHSPKFSLTVGTGFAFQYFNNLRQGGESGTPVRLDKYSTSSPIALRLQVNYAISETKEVRFLVSPFTQSGSFTATEKVQTKDVVFEKGEKIDTRFSFSSVRLGFANKVTEGAFSNFKIGATLIVRKWETRQKSATKNSEDNNWLALPLLYVGYEKKLAPKTSVTADLDVIGIPSAYALEGGAALNFDVVKAFQVSLQYRILSGFFTDGSIKNAFTGQNIGLALTAKF